MIEGIKRNRIEQIEHDLEIFNATTEANVRYLLEQNKALVEALEWYSREDSYDVEEDEYYPLISIDRGDKAREVLTTYKGDVK